MLEISFVCPADTDGSDVASLAVEDDGEVFSRLGEMLGCPVDTDNPAVPCVTEYAIVGDAVGSLLLTISAPSPHTTPTPFY